MTVQAGNDSLTSGSADGTELQASVEWSPGHVIDGMYEVRALIGRGGMGTVYRVRHWDWNVDLALKVPHARLVADRVAKERFILEAHTWIDLGVHPNIVQCWFVRELDGVPLLFLDLIPGGSLKDWRKTGTVKPGQWDRILDLMLQACDGLAHAHEHGLVHRDVKPANLLLRDDQRLCVTDFGLVKVGSPEASGAGGQFSAQELAQAMASSFPGRDAESSEVSAALTATGALVGTPEYGAPEQWLQARTVGPQADLYALGIILYELCCGRRPFDDGQQRVNPALLVGRHISRPAPDPRQFNPDIPEQLVTVVLGCLEKNPDDRPESAGRLREDLERAYRDIVGQDYPRARPRAGVQRAEALNNKAVSLFNLGHSQEAFDAWREASRLDPLHPETVYNRSVQQWRLGQIETGEVLRRLTQSRLAHPHAGAYLGFFHLECQRLDEAESELLSALAYPEAARNGAVWRALGDARMYLERFPQAEEAYGEALDRMPGNGETLARLTMASSATRVERKRIRFPLDRPWLTVECGMPITATALAGRSALLAGPQGLQRLDRRTGEVGWTWAAGEQGIVPAELVASSDAGLVITLATPGGRVWSLESGQCLQLLEERQRFYSVLPGARMALAGLVDLNLVTLPGCDSVLTLQGHTRQVAAVTCTSDGRFALSGAADRTARYWDLHTGQCLQVLEGHTDKVTAVALSRDGAYAVTGSRDRSLRLWELSSGECLTVFPGESGDVRRIRLTGDGRYAVVGRWDPGQEDFLEVWDLSTGDRLFSRRGGLFSVLPDGVRVLAGTRFGEAGTLRLWEIATGRCVRTLAGHSHPIQALCLSSDARHALSGGEDGVAKVWEIDEGSRVYERSLVVKPNLDHTEAEATQSRFRTHLDQAQAELAAGHHAQAYRHLVEARRVTGYTRDPAVLAINARLLQALPPVGLRAVWEVRSLSEYSSAQPTAVSIREDGATLATGAGKLIRLWETASGSCVRGFAGHQDLIRWVCVTPDGTHLVSGSQDGSLRVWNLQTGDCELVCSTLSPVVGAALSADSSQVLAITAEGLGVWDPTTGEAAFKATLAGLSLVDATTDLRLALVGGEECLELWDLREARPLVRTAEWRNAAPEEPVSPEATNVSALTVSCDGKLAVTGHPGGSLRLLHLETGRILYILSGHRDRVTGLGLTRDGRYCASASLDGSLRVWDLAGGTCLETIDGHAGPVLAMAMTEDGRFLASAGSDQTVRVWELDWELDPEGGPTAFSDTLGKAPGLLDRLTSLFRRRRVP